MGRCGKERVHHQVAMRRPTPQIVPTLDPEFLPAVLWHQSYDAHVEESGGTPLAIGLDRGTGVFAVHRMTILADEDSPAAFALNFKAVERTCKFLLWQKGASTFRIAGSERIVKALSAAYSEGGAHEFDWSFLGKKAFGTGLVFQACRPEDLDADPLPTEPIGRHLNGNRIGFDLGGSDRKAAAVIDGKVVFSEEIPWDPYFQSDPAYHFEGILDSLRRAATHLPSVDAIGGSAAGIYVDNEVRAGSLFRGVSEEDFETQVQKIFFRVMEEGGWADVPWQVVNDGDVTALAGSMSLESNGVLGISMGTSEAAGYVDPQGNLRPWLNELAFTPIDYREEEPIDEWSKDVGCGVQFFSQQGVGRLVPKSGIDLPSDMPLPEKLEEVQSLMSKGDDRAAAIFSTIGTCFGYAIAHYASFYDIEKLLILGRVTSGEGGSRIIADAETVLTREFPLYASKVSLVTPNEKDKRHGQAIAAASLPRID